MARYCKWTHLWTAGFLLFFFVQATIVIHYAQKLEEETLDNVPVSAVSLLSKANVSTEIRAWRREIQRLNQAQLVRNSAIFGNFTARKNATNVPVFVIQVHDRVAYLEALIGSLQRVRGIEEALLVFSHDVYSKEINDVVADVKFARVMQIYYPYSSQLYPKGYPGPDANGTVLPPGYGRTANLTQIKLHWVWKLTQVFRDLTTLKNHTGPKIFLEEDHYVLPDVLHVLSKTQTMKVKSCPFCVIILGGYPKEKLWHDLEWGVVKLTRFFASGNNMGMVFENRFFDDFLKCGNVFCEMDDYNWDWTIQHLHLTCFLQSIQILKPDAPRVWHIGDCGTHTKKHQKWKCKKMRIFESAKKIENLVKNNEEKLFSDSMKMVSALKVPLPATPNVFGGWGDPRDHNLCRAIIRGD